jgi:rSAM/selenodomain-associated transferase 1
VQDASQDSTANAGYEVLVFAKYPEPGRCKTRLAKSLGEEDALRIYAALLSHTLSVVSATAFRKILFVDPPERAAEAHTWAPGMDLYLPQSDGDLGARLWDAVDRRLAAGAKRIILLGCDCPQISKDTVTSSFAALDFHDVVLGPTVDGGYYLLALKAGHASLFQDIPWSTELVLERTLNILKIQSLSYLSLDTFSDVDTLDDYRRARHLEPLKYLGIR